MRRRDGSPTDRIAIGRGTRRDNRRREINHARGDRSSQWRRDLDVRYPQSQLLRLVGKLLRPRLFCFRGGEAKHLGSVFVLVQYGFAWRAWSGWL